ncbi:hypothetical protein PanWU01x14_058480 [Parasponia andersonii]|uniref:Uncharacterized protein n=1 Tax=Parasponia andersonii TaxID=3476 RepID=A0A2P5DJ68_PARAD|nr:hypothetical protein PanWU01x14_058480 [Parasponia andersonii]
MLLVGLDAKTDRICEHEDISDPGKHHGYASHSIAPALNCKDYFRKVENEMVDVGIPSGSWIKN